MVKIFNTILCGSNVMISSINLPHDLSIFGAMNGEIALPPPKPTLNSPDFVVNEGIAAKFFGN
jgi:hypothetical protein